MKIISRSVFCIFAVSLLLLLTACSKAEYSVKDFADITVVGYTEHGSLSIKVNDAAVNRIYADGKKDKTAALRFADTFRFSYEGENDEDSYFTNGDVVTINVTYDETMAKDLGITFVDSSFEYTIEGLEDKVQMSPFDGLSVKFSGVAPYGTVQIDKSNCIQYVIDNVTFLCDYHDLSNGDKVIVRAEYNADIAERNGYVFTEDAKKFTVVGLSKYVTTMMGVTYSPITARMRYMVEQYVGGTETAYKTFSWYFGDEDSDSDSDGFIDEDENSDNTGLFEDASDADLPDDEEGDGDDEEGDGEDAGEDGETASISEDGETESGSSSASKKKRKTNVQRIKDDFVLSEFDAKFDYKPVQCYYALNPLQYSDNIFYSVYKVKGTFVCESTSGSGYINVGDTVVGEIYITASLTGGSVDIKNNLVYEDTTLENSHAYSIRTYPEYEDMTADVFKSTTYVVEMLDYVEDDDAYDKFVKDQAEWGTHSRTEVSHISVSSSSDTDSEKKRRRSSSSEEETETEIETDTDEGGGEYYDEESEYYYDEGADDGYYNDDGYGYDEGYDDGYGYDY